MNDKYSVILKLVWYNQNGHPHFYNYTCKHIIGGLKELVFNLEFDKEYFSYAYRHSETTLQFIKDDMIEILNCSTGNSVVDSGGNRIQDHSYIASGKINIKIVDNHTNIVFLESFLDLNRQKITPLYLEVPLIENVDIKEKIENEISYSLEEIKNSVLNIDTSDYEGNPIIEEASLLGVGMIDDSWGGASNIDPSTVYQANNNHWYFTPTQYLAVEGQSDNGIHASGEMWGRYAARGGIEVLSGIDVITTNVGGFTIKDMGRSIVLDLKISFYLKRKRFVKVMGTISHYRQTKLNLILTTYDEYSSNTRSFLVKTIHVRLEGEYEIYEIKDFQYRKVLNFSSSASQPYNIRGYFTIRFPQDIEKPTQVDTSLGDEAYRYNFYVVENTATTKGYSFRCDAIIDAACNSKKDAKNKLFGIRLLDYLSFISNKAGVNVSYPTLIDYGLNNILYSSDNLLNFRERQISDNKYLEKIENCSLKNILDWLNTQFCLSIYVDEDNKLTLTTRDYFVNLALGGRQGMIDVNRVIEIMPQKFIKRIYAGSVRNEVQFVSSYESSNTECTWELETELDGTELNILCPICTDPQFIDWMLMAKTITGGKKCLIETITRGTTVSLNVVKPTKITPNKTGETISNPFPNFTNFTTRNFTNVFLSPLAQFQRWRRYITTPPNNLQYKMIKCDTNFINIIYGIHRTAYRYQQIYAANINYIYFNNSDTKIGGIPDSMRNVRVGVRNYDQNGHLLPLKFKVETPIYSQFLQARRKAVARFTYNGKTIIGYPNVVKTFFGEQVQEIEIEAIETSTITNINDLIE